MKLSRKFVWSVLTASLLIILISNSAKAQVAFPSQGLAFDYDQFEFDRAQITRFEIKINTNSYETVGIPPIVATNGTIKSYRVAIPALTPGNYTVVFRACNAVGCSADSAPSFNFTLVVVVAPSNIRVVP